MTAEPKKYEIRVALQDAGGDGDEPGRVCYWLEGESPSLITTAYALHLIRTNQAQLVVAVSGGEDDPHSNWETQPIILARI